MKTGSQSPKLLYKAKTQTIGGRERGVAISSDGHLNIRFSAPGTDETGTNPEQLFAAGWSACFEGAMVVIASKMNVSLPADTIINAEVDLCIDNEGYCLQGQLNISIPRMNRELAQEVIDGARRVCPYTKAVSGNMQVNFNLL